MFYWCILLHCKGIIIVFSFLKDKTLSDIWTHEIKRIDFTPKFSKVSSFYIKKQVNLIESLMIQLFCVLAIHNTSKQSYDT